jgi:hypothetical protein
MKWLLNVTTFFLLLLFVANGVAWAQQSSEEKRKTSHGESTKSTGESTKSIGESAKSTGESTTTQGQGSMRDGGLSTSEIALSIGVLVFTILVICIFAWIRVKGAISGDAASKLIGLTLVIGSGMFLMSAGWSQQQVTPVVGLLGTGLGFIFGKSMSGDEAPKNTPSGPGRG